MDKGKLKFFAAEARRRLISHISARIGFILTNDTAEFIAKAALKEKLRSAWEKAPDREEFIERHAYTLFNRLIALRFMDVRGYNFVPVVTPRVVGGDPGILADARSGLFQPDLPVDTQKISALLTGKIPTHNPFNEAYKLLFIAACGWYNKQLPFMFEPLNSYTELLLPDDLLSTNSIISYINQNLGVEECENVEVIGWLYQFYISEKKDKVYADTKNAANRKKDEIAAITQLFTPAWIVKYLVENSLGKLWMLNNPRSPLMDSMKYFVQTDLKKGNIPQINSPEEIKILDPAEGSGHMLVYVFELLMKIYEEVGYFKKDIPTLILKNNITGLEIDNRAASLASFALMMKAMEYDRSILTKSVFPKIYSFGDERVIKEWDIEGIRLKERDRINAEYLAAFFKDADILGSLIDPKFSGKTVQVEMFTDLSKKEEMEKYFDEETTVISSLPEKLAYSAALYGIMADKYHVVVTNPPYLPGNANPVLKKYLEKHYPDSKSDLFAAFIERCLSFNGKNCFTAMITQHQWMFLSSFEKLREKLIKDDLIDTLVHLGARAFEEIGGEVVQSSAFVMLETKPEDEKGVFVRLVDYKDAKLKEVKFLEGNDRFLAAQSNFSKIPGSPIAYWVSERIISAYDGGILGEHYKCRKGMDTGENDRFLRFWFEISIIKSSFTINGSNSKWFPYNKGGEYRRWYGNRDYLINWRNDGSEIRSRLNVPVNKPTLRNMEFQKQESLTWSSVSSSKLSLRYSPAGSFFDNGGSSIFGHDLFPVLGFLNSVVAEVFLKFTAPTINFQPGDLESIAYNAIAKSEQNVTKLTDSAISISRLDWDSRETSWDFKAPPLILDYNSETTNPELGPPPRKPGEDLLISQQYEQYKAYWTEKFFQLHRNEEELNRIFIKIYGLEEELTPDVELKDVTILQPEKIITPDGGLEFKQAEVIKQFISWSVGCMFGRYSPDKPGLILANQGETLKDFLDRVPEPSFLPDEDNIIPVLDDEYFADDIVARFKKFVETLFGRQHFTTNIRFIEESLGMDVRKYFVKEFHKDHLQRYKKRPIYWLISSPAGSFNALIYMHRYNNQTMSKIFNDYLKEFRSKLISRLKDIQDGIFTGNNPVREEDRLRKQLKDVEDFILTMTPFAMNPITIDLDDGVKVNITKFAGVVKGI